MSAGSDETPARRFRRAATLVACLLAAGCGGFLGSGGGEEDPETRFRAAAAALESGRFEPAARTLRELASRCESGTRGRDAVLLLAAVEVDPRNPRPSPAAGAQLAARYLQIPGGDPSTATLAETLYLLALDLGATPVDDPFSSVPAAPASDAEDEGETANGGEVRFWRVAERFEGCGEGGRRSAGVTLPEHPGMPLWQAVESAYQERDSLAARSAAGAEEAARLRVRVDSLQAELERVRSLLQQGPGGRPPDSMRR